MINILIGPKGTGKTKVFIDMVNQAKETEKGNCLIWNLLKNWRENQRI